MTHEGRSESRAQPGEVFGAYLVYERLGVGGMAEVYRAKKRGIEGFERQVALKRLLPALAADDEFVRSFVREARLASQLRHVNIAQTYDLGRIGGTYFIAMELVDGKDLRQILRHTAYATGPMPVPLILSVLVQLCEALDYAHTLKDEAGQPLGIIHRDVSPSNVIVDCNGTTKLIDFGIARVSAGTLHTVSGQIKGKFSYMAPEVLVGQLDARTDLWSLGVVAWELLTAQPLFTGSDDIAVLERVRGQDIPPPSSINRHCPRDLDAIVMTALSRNPTQRWQTAAQLRGAIDSLAHRPGMGASHQDLVRWIDWAFAQPAGARRWDERGAGGIPGIIPGMGAADEPSIVIEVGPPPNMAQPPGPSAMRTLLAAEPPNLPLPARPSSVLAAARTIFVEGTPAPEPLVSHATSPWLAPNLRAPARGTPSPYGNDPLPPGPPAYPSPNVPYAPYTPHGAVPPASYPGYQGYQGYQGQQGPTMVPPPPSGYATVAAPPVPSSARQTVSALPPQAMSARARVVGMAAPHVPPAIPAGKGPPPSPAMGTPVGNPLDSPEYRAALAAFEARIAPMQQRQQAAPYAQPGQGQGHGQGQGMTPRAAQMMALPTAQPRRNLGFVVVMVLCAFAAAGGYLLVHWLSTH